MRLSIIRLSCLNSEAVLHTSFDAKAKLVEGLLFRQEGDFTIDVGAVGDIDTQPSLAADFGFVLFAVNSHDGRATLNIEASGLTKTTLVADVEISYGAVEIITGITDVGFSVHIRTCQGSGSRESDSGGRYKCRFNHSSYSKCLAEFTCG